MKSPLVKQTQCLPTFILDFRTDVQSPANGKDTATWLLIRQRSPYSLSNSRICTWGASRLPTLCDRTAGQNCLVGRNANQLFTCDPQPLRFRRTEQIKIIPDYTPSPSEKRCVGGIRMPGRGWQAARSPARESRTAGSVPVSRRASSRCQADSNLRYHLST